VKMLIFGQGYFHSYFYFKKLAKRELQIIEKNWYFFSHTSWTSAYLKLINPGVRIFSCRDILRKSFYTNRWEWPAIGYKFIFISINNGEVYKGWDNILRIASILSKHTDLSFEWRIIGTSPGKSECRLFERKAKVKFKDNHIIFAGRMSETEIVDQFQQGHLFIHPSHIDNSPNSLCEAMLSGMPVLCADVGGCSSLITHEKDGLLLPDNDPYYWASQIVKLLSDRTRLELLGSNARARALIRHDPAGISKLIMEAYTWITTQE
jgi:glycosyltransferase involved in cell wall biosynthesis